MPETRSPYWQKMRQEIIKRAKKRAYEVAKANDWTEESARNYAEQAWQNYTEEVTETLLFGEEEPQEGSE